MSVAIARTGLPAGACNLGVQDSVAIVGGGPRGLHCLESLARAVLGRAGNRPLTVTIYEPAPTLGAGTVYEPTQPHYLRMNFASKHIQAWAPYTTAAPSRPSLVQWLQQHHPDLADPHAAIPRAIVGQYLNDCFKKVASGLPPMMQLRIERTKVRQIHRHGQRWEVVTAAGGRRQYDEVMLTVGHEGWRDNPCGVYPVDQKLSTERIAPNTWVVIRGFALTWIDATLALTEGRGGTFNRTPHGFEYCRSGREPAKITPRSRSLRPMLGKPDEAIVQYLWDTQPVWKRANARVEALPQPDTGLDFQYSLWPLVTQAAAEALHTLGAGANVNVHEWFEAWLSKPMSPPRAEALMRQSYRVATGRCQPGAAWALGEAWRQLYAAMVRRISHGGLAVDSWADFRIVAREMERIAFGPPAENLGRMLALVDANLVDFSGAYEDRVDVHQIDAVLASPTDSPVDSPIAGLLRKRILQRLPGGEGIHVDRCGRPIDAGGRVVDGLAILGRPTEGCIIGNDTLSRSLHQHPERWAESVVHNLSRSQASVSRVFTKDA